MTKEQKTDVKVGATVFVAVTLLMLGIIWAKQINFGTPAETAQAWFATAGGLGKGDAVLVSGIKSGVVAEIVNKDGGVLATLTFDHHVDLRKDATASITMLELMGGKKVDLQPGRSTERLPAGAIIPGIYSGDISSLVAMVTALSGTLQSIAGRADTLFASLNGVMGGDTLKQKISATLTTVNTAATQLTKVLAEDGPAMRRTFEGADQLTNELSSAISENRAGFKVFIDTGSRAMMDARVALARANLLAMRLDSMLVMGGEPNTLLYRLTRDPAFSQRLDSAVTSLVKLSEQIRVQGIDANIRFFNSAKPGK